MNDLEPKIFFPITGSTQNDDLLPVTIVRFELYPSKFIDIAINIDDVLRRVCEKYPNEFKTIIQKIINEQQLKEDRDDYYNEVRKGIFDHKE